MALDATITELRTLASALKAVADKEHETPLRETIRETLDACSQIGLSWSYSCLGYQSRVYYRGFAPPPPGAHFSVEWGLMTMPWGGPAMTGSVGDWVEYSNDDVIAVIEDLAGRPDRTPLQQLSKEAKGEFESGLAEFKSILTALDASVRDNLTETALEQANAMKLPTQRQLLATQLPKGEFHTRDQVAANQGWLSPPHLTYQAGVIAQCAPLQRSAELSQLAEQLANHLQRKETAMTPGTTPVGRVFIGHGGSKLWLELKNYVQDHLDLLCDDFNRPSTAGVATSARLTQMLDSACFALIVSTGEDEQVDGKVRARENVVHESGLFQGRLGFSKAIVLLEEGCEEFSNISGLGQIRFPKGTISSCFHEVRDVLVREGVLVA